MTVPDVFAAFPLDTDSVVPPYRQVHAAVVRGISSGVLLPGQKLPTIRALAAELGLAVNTVAAAYRSLEESGIVEGRGRAGTFVALGDDPVTTEARTVALEAAARLRALGLDTSRSIAIFADAVEATTSL